MKFEFIHDLLSGTPRIETEGFNYSPMSYSGTVTPSSQAFLTRNSEEAYHYYELIQKALKRYNTNYNVRLSGGSFEICQGVYAVVQLRNVTEAIHVSNIYHVIKAMEGNLDGCFTYLRDHGIPTLVQATNTGNTPPFDQDDFRLDGFDLY